METRYDVIVAGAGISGLMAAAIVANKGYRVAIVPGEKRPSIYEKGGYRFNTGPVQITGLNSGPLGFLFDELGIPRGKGTRENISYQVVLPDERVDMYEEPELFMEEIRRCFPKEIEKISRFYNSVSGLGGEIRRVMELDPFSVRLFMPSGIRKGKMSLKGLTQSLGLSSGFQTFINAQISSFSYLHGPASALSASSLLGSAGKGFYFLDDGSDHLKHLLLGKIKAFDCDIVGSPAREISWNGNRWLLRTDDEALSGRAVIGNMEASIFCGLFLQSNRSYLKKAEKVKKALYPLTINLGVKKAGVPSAMADNVILLRDWNKEPASENLLFVQMAPSANGRKTLSFTCHIPEEECGKERVREISEKVLEEVDRLCPFIDRHTEVVDIRYPDLTGEGKFVTSLKQRMGTGTLPYKISDQVFLAGPEVFPSLGFDGLVYSAEMAASSAIKMLEKRRA